MRKEFTIKLKNRYLELGRRTLIMGILNVTPDSFSDGGRFIEQEAAIKHALQMVRDGADIIDVGGESTRPGAESLNLDEELRRVIPVIKELKARCDTPISIDTYKSSVARAAIKAGADIINDISGCRFDKEMARLAAETKTPTIVMHIKGTPKDMQTNPTYSDVVGEVTDYLRGSIMLLTNAGLPREQIIIDPGIGFGKTIEHNLIIMNRLDQFAGLDHPILIGVSKKSVIGKVLDLPVSERKFGTAAAVAANTLKGAHIVRVHDVAEMREVALIIDAIINEKTLNIK